MASEKDTSAVAPKATWFWIKNSNGDASASLTFATIAFLVTSVVFIGASLENVGPVSFKSFDTAGATIYYLTALGLYFGRRLTEAKFSNPTQKDEKVNN